MGSSGARYQIIILKVERNEYDAVKELSAATHYLDTECKERFKVIGSFYGRTTNLLPRITHYLLVNKLIPYPFKTLYQVSKEFINNGNINVVQASILGYVKALDDLGTFIKGGVYDNGDK